ncbi:hypothetical protein GGX14DRAFT_594662 [Mycena pura]|uniref:Uncharacterized protein n=1 Tax=Mycena pura TaxID=153505 RepID=A0AAD6VVT7_9AGAR|nr:hypothetical protein GGX14DRAFT_594662 [Mycena pura]
MACSLIQRATVQQGTSPGSLPVLQTPTVTYFCDGVAFFVPPHESLCSCASEPPPCSCHCKRLELPVSISSIFLSEVCSDNAGQQDITGRLKFVSTLIGTCAGGGALLLRDDNLDDSCTPLAAAARTLGRCHSRGTTDTRSVLDSRCMHSEAHRSGSVALWRKDRADVYVSLLREPVPADSYFRYDGGGGYCAVSGDKGRRGTRCKDRLEPSVKRPGTSASNNTGTGALTGANASLSTPPTPRAYSRASIDSTHRLLHLRLSPLRKVTDDLSRPKLTFANSESGSLDERPRPAHARIWRSRKPTSRSRAQELLDDANFLYAGEAAHVRGPSFSEKEMSQAYRTHLADVNDKWIKVNPTVTENIRRKWYKRASQHFAPAEPEKNTHIDEEDQDALCL